MKELKYSDLDCYIFLSDEDQSVVERCFKKNVPLFYDELGRVYTRWNVHIANIEVPFGF